MTLTRTKPESNLSSRLDHMRSTDEILGPLNDLTRIVDQASTLGGSEAVDLLAPIASDDSDGLLSRIAIRALSQVSSIRADELLTHLLHRRGDVAAHAAWALSSRRPYLRALAPLVELAEEGGFGKMMAELAIENWMREIPELAWRPEMTDASRRLGRRVENLQHGRRRHPGLRIAQVLMQGRVDVDLTSAAKGDGGGLITLQVGLAAELTKHPSVADVFVISRSIKGEAESLGRPFEPIGHKGTLARIEFGPEGYLPTADMWAHRADLEHELRRFLKTQGPFDALHLRFMDVGTFAAARVAKELDIPIFFTLAPDPHSLISTWESSGVLTRANFSEFDSEQHLFFRAWLLQEMLQDAEKLALLPRRGQREELLDLMNLDVAEDPKRYVSIPEGVDFRRTLNAQRTLDHSAGIGQKPSVLRELNSAIRRLPEGRRGLPLLLSVGRMHPVKGFDRLIAAWSGQPRLRESFNLVIVGGDLESPSSTESEALAAIDEVRGRAAAGGEGLILLGSKSHSEVALLMAATESGFGDLIGGNGIYVAASEKEEFGLAIVEAMAAGLPVVAPEVGGPGMYIDHEVTGFLTDTTDVAHLAKGIAWAADHRMSDVRAARARQKVSSEYSLTAMADDLVALYSPESASSLAS